MIKIGSPMWIIRRECEEDLLGTIERVAKAGFDGIEFLGFYGHSAEEVKAKMDEVGMISMSSHVPFEEFRKDPEGVLQYHATLGCPYIVVGNVPLADMEQAKADIHALAEAARPYGITLLYHNHGQELKAGDDGVEILEKLMETVPAEDLKLEPDLGWIRIGGGDPARYLKKYRDRCPIVHLKDYFATDDALIGETKDFGDDRGPAERGGFEFRPVGYGVMDFAGLKRLVDDCEPVYLVADHDLAYERDSFEDLKLSLDFMRVLWSL